MSKKLKKYILFLLILVIFSGISYSIGVYSYYYKIFPFNTSSKIEAKKTRISSAFYDFDMIDWVLIIFFSAGSLVFQTF